MATSSQVLREYLVSLGYRVDQPSQRKFDTSVIRSEALVGGLAKSIVGVGTAAVVAAGLFARSMERLYYSSIKAETAAGKLQALEFGGKMAGLDNMRAAVEGMARAVRLNPGLVGLLESLGVRTAGRSTADQMLDLVGQLRKMPFYVASQYANLFGISPDDLLLMEHGLEKMKEAASLRERLAKDAGLDLEKATEVGVIYANTLTEIWEKVGIVKDTAMIALLPAFQEVADVTKMVLDDWVKIAKEFDKPASLWGRFAEGMRWQKPGGGVVLSAESRTRLGMKPTFEQQMDKAKADYDARKAAVSPNASPAEKSFKWLERTYGLPEGTLDKMWKKESNRGQNMLSPAGAQGHFQFMPETAKQYGLTDPNDLGQSSRSAAQYMGDLLRKYGGDFGKALAAYNWGPGNVDRKGLGAAPLETRNYVRDISGRDITVETNITVNGSSDPEATGKSVGDAVGRVNSTILRNNLGNVR